MFGGLFSILGWLNPKRLMMIGVALVLGWLAIQTTQFVNQAIEDRTRVVVLEIENQSLEQTLQTKQFLLDEQVRATEAAEEALRAEQERAREFESAIDNTIDVDPERDGPVAPVLEEALDFIRDRRGL